MNTFTTRKVTEADLPVLKRDTGRDESKRLKPDGKSYHPENCVMVVEEDGKIIGCTAVLFTRPHGWGEGDRDHLYPEIRALAINDEHRNKGAGTHLINAVEEEARSRGCKHLHLSVNPTENPGAYRLYQRLGYRTISEEAHRHSWTYTDEEGVTHEVVEWVIDTVKDLT